MTNPSNHRPLQVTTSRGYGAYIELPVTLVERVRALLQDNDIPHWVEHLVISVDDRPAETVIHLGLKADPRRVQELLDAAA